MLYEVITEVQRPGQTGARLAPSAALRRPGWKPRFQVGYPEALSRSVGGVPEKAEKGRSKGLLIEKGVLHGVITSYSIHYTKLYEYIIGCFLACTSQR